jgi:hypothetical protein
MVQGLMVRRAVVLIGVLALPACSTSGNDTGGASQPPAGSGPLARAVVLDNLCSSMQFDPAALNAAAVAAGFADGDAAMATFNAPGGLEAAKAGLQPSANYCAVAAAEYGPSGTTIPGLLVNS